MAAVLGSSTGRHIDTIAKRRSLITSETAFDEAYRVVGHLRPADLPLLEYLLDLVTVVSQDDIFEDDRTAARIVLRNASASRNGSTSDDHLLVLAWTLDADLWSHDRDFAGTGWPSWSTTNLVAAVRDPTDG